MFRRKHQMATTRCAFWQQQMKKTTKNTQTHRAPPKSNTEKTKKLTTSSPEQRIAMMSFGFLSYFPCLLYLWYTKETWEDKVFTKIHCVSCLLINVRSCASSLGIHHATDLRAAKCYILAPFRRQADSPTSIAQNLAQQQQKKNVIMSALTLFPSSAEWTLSRYECSNTPICKHFFSIRQYISSVSQHLERTQLRSRHKQKRIQMSSKWIFIIRYPPRAMRHGHGHFQIPLSTVHFILYAISFCSFSNWCGLTVVWH